MKKYLTVAAILGAIAFVSVSYLAQATEATSEVTTAVEATTTDAPAMQADVAVDAAVASDCEASVAASFEGKTATDEEKAAAVKACEDSKAGVSGDADMEVAPADETAPE